MIFKSIRYLIYSPLVLIIEDKRIEDVDTHDSDINIYDNYEVIGIRANTRHFDTFEEDTILVSLKPTITSYYDCAIDNQKYSEKHISEQARGK